MRIHNDGSFLLPVTKEEIMRYRKGNDMYYVYMIDDNGNAHIVGTPEERDEYKALGYRVCTSEEYYARMHEIFAEQDKG